MFVLPIVYLGAFAVSLFLSFLISKYDVKGSKLALIGLAIGAICTAIVQFLLIRNPLEANKALVWLTGSLYGYNYVEYLYYITLVFNKDTNHHFIELSIRCIESR